MDKTTALRYDVLLTEVCKLPKNSWHISHIYKTSFSLGFTKEETDTAVSSFINDGFLVVLEPFEKNYNNHFQLYSVSPKAIAFIHHEGGYTNRRRFKNYEKTNIKFTWIRHWVWFYTAVGSLLLNLVLTVLYLLK